MLNNLFGLHYPLLLVLFEPECFVITCVLKNIDCFIKDKIFYQI